MILTAQKQKHELPALPSFLLDVEAMKRHGAVYFAATGGAAALISKRITACEITAYEDLGAEAIRKLTVEDFPVIVAQDCHGGNIYKDGQKRYAR